MKVKCVRTTSYNGDNYESYITLDKTYYVLSTDILAGAFTIQHDKGKGMLPIHLFEILEEE